MVIISRFLVFSFIYVDCTSYLSHGGHSKDGEMLASMQELNQQILKKNKGEGQGTSYVIVELNVYDDLLEC